MRILLVEDNVNIAKGLIYSLEQKEYKVIHTENVKDTIDILNKDYVDLIVLDISLPDGNGFDLYEKYIKPKNIRHYISNS